MRAAEYKNQCEKMVDPRLPYPTSFNQCEREGTVEVDGKYYCWQHDPERKAKKDAIRTLGYRITTLRERTIISCKLTIADAVLELDNLSVNAILTRPLEKYYKAKRELAKSEAELAKLKEEK